MISETQSSPKTKKSTKCPLPSSSEFKRPRKGGKREDEDSIILKRAVTVMENAVAAQTRPKISAPHSTTDADDLFGHYISNELKTIRDEYTKKILKHKIQNILFETQMSSLSALSNPTNNVNTHSAHHQVVRVSLTLAAYLLIGSLHHLQHSKVFQLDLLIMHLIISL